MYCFSVVVVMRWAVLCSASHCVCCGMWSAVLMHLALSLPCPPPSPPNAGDDDVMVYRIT